MLSQPPYSLVNLPSNLLPVQVDSTVEELVALLEEYDGSEGGAEVLEITIKNLQGRDKDSLNYTYKWNLINQNLIWAKKSYQLLK